MAGRGVDLGRNSCGGLLGMNVGGSPERFGYAWDRYSGIKPEYEEQFKRWLPFFAPSDWIGQRFVDVGCGMGRNTFWPMHYGAAQGHAVDLDERSLAAASGNLSSFPNAEVLKCSGYDLPWHAELDIAYSIGVIHHLEFPDRALASMSRAVKPGGQVAIWVYGRENNGWLLWALDPTRKLLFSWMPISWVHFLSLFPTALLWLLLRIGLNQIEYFRLLRKFSFSHLRSIVFDQMLPRIANYWTKTEVEALMIQAGLERVELAWVNQMSWAARGWVKPSAESP
jgi:SAM-dependent methyltransferase